MFLSLSTSGTFERIADHNAVERFGALYVRKTHERASAISHWYERSAFVIFGDCIAIPSRRGTSFYLVHKYELSFNSCGIFPALEVVPRACGILDIYVLGAGGEYVDHFEESFTF